MSDSAARSLAAILTDVATDLNSNDLATVSRAMTAVRAAARRLESSLTARGWGGDVMYGWGDHHDPGRWGHDAGDGPGADGNEDEDDDLDEDVDLVEEDGGDKEDGEVPDGAIRVTYQARFDFYIVDEEALTERTLKRAAERGWDLDREYLDSHGGAFGTFAETYGLDELDLAGTGLVFAGGQSTTGPTEQTLWEMDEQEMELRDDQFPTAR